METNRYAKISSAFPSGGGEMGERIRSYDWSTHPLGPVEHWPQPLCTTLNLVLNCPLPMALCWGSDQFCFFNDAYQLRLGSDVVHIAAPGQPIGPHSPDIWQPDNSLLDAVLTTGEAVCQSDQRVTVYLHGERNELNWTFSYSPVVGETGKSAGVLITIVETTEKVKASGRREAPHEPIQRAGYIAQLALEGADVGSFVIDLTDNNLTHSPTLARLFTGRETVNLTRAQLLTYVHPDDLSIREKAYREAARTGRLSYKARLVWDDGTIRWLKVHGTYLLDEQGVRTRFSGIAQDITEEVQAQHEQQKLLSLVENSADYIAVSDTEGRLTYLNQAGRALSGLADQPLDNLRIQDFTVTSADQLPHLNDLLGPTGHDRLPQLVDLRHLQTGELIPCHANYVAITDPMNGQSIGQGATLRDLRPELASRQELIESEAKLQKANQRLEMALDAARLGSYELDWATGRMTCNPQCKANFGLPADARFDFPDLLSVIVPEDRKRVETVVQESIETNGVYSCEYRVTWPDGSLHWVRASGRSTYDESGNPLKMVGVSLDITPEQVTQLKLERQVEERTKELKTANQALLRTNNELEQFAYIASHDLQEPLRKIQSFASLLQESQQSEELTDLYLDKITKSAQRMSALIKAVLNYSRLSKTDDQFRQIDLNGILESVLTDFELLIDQKEAHIQFDRLPTVLGIPLQLNQLLTNLIGNSLKFSNTGAQISISTGPATADQISQQPNLNPALSYVWIAVQDNGIGFDQQYADRIFTLFQRLGNSKTYSGTGIGLALCKRIVDNHNGVITAHSIVGQGATFTVYLPTTQP
ncbi:PAS domain-containing sensor histidine kinase [Spirosoma fluminis]